MLWGVVATLAGVTQNYAGLIACRLFLGAFEAGLFPGMTIYLTFFYTKRELALRVGYLFVSSALAGACGGLLAYAIGQMDGVSGLRGWRWIFILEGIPTVVLGVATWFLLADDPEHARYLSPAEKAMMLLRRGREAGQTASAQQLHRKDALAAPADWKVLAFCVGQFGVDTMLYGYSTFLPTIIDGMGNWSSTQVQALTIPCYSLGAVTYLFVAWLSDAQQRRGLYTAIFGAIAVVGYGLLISNTSGGVHYLGCFVVALGLYVAVGLPLAWLPSNLPRYGKKTVATGLQLSLEIAAASWRLLCVLLILLVTTILLFVVQILIGILLLPAPQLYKTAEGPRYVRGHAVTLGMVAYATILYGFMSVRSNSFPSSNALRRT